MKQFDFFVFFAGLLIHFWPSFQADKLEMEENGGIIKQNYKPTSKHLDDWFIWICYVYTSHLLIKISKCTYYTVLHDPINNENVLLLVDICPADTGIRFSEKEREWEAIRAAHNQFLTLSSVENKYLSRKRIVVDHFIARNGLLI